jgi:5-methylcytosine-specific restriction endonuclease McrA
MSAAGRRHSEYIAARKRFQTGNYTCHICGQQPGLTPDHQPPLANFPHPNLWHGTLQPACQPCQSRQGAAITNARHTNHWRL